MKRYPTRWRSLSNAFTRWLACQNINFRAEVVATKRQGRVNLAFPRCPSLNGRVRHNCLAVYACDANLQQCAVLELDSLPIRLDGTQTFVCGFCEGEQREFDGREALWADHLFEPFADWVRMKLQTLEEKTRIANDAIDWLKSSKINTSHFRPGAGRLFATGDNVRLSCIL